MMSHDHLFKLVLSGSAGVGKSAILQRFSENSFREQYDPTIGVEFGAKTIQAGGKTVKLQVWDTAGQEQFRAITRSYYRGSHGVFLVYDVTNRETLYDQLPAWQSDATQFTEPGTPIIVVGNKCDVSSKRQVSTEEGLAWAQAQGYDFFEVSAKSNENINHLFEATAEAILKRVQASQSAHTDQLLVDNPDTGVPGQAPPAPPTAEIIASVAAALPELLKGPDLPLVIEKFVEKISDKASVFKFGLTVGEFDQPKCGLTLRHKSGSEASSVAYDLGLGAGSVGIALSLKATDNADSFQLGELSAILKGLLEPFLNTEKSSFDVRVVSEFDGTKIFRMVFEIKDDALCIATKAMMDRIGSSKLDLDLELSQRPVRQSPPEFLFGRLKVDTESKRGGSILGAPAIAERLNMGPTSDVAALLSTLKHLHCELEFDSVAEFWTTIVDKAPPPFIQLGWHSIEHQLREYIRTTPFLAEEPYSQIYKNLEGIAGLHSLVVVMGGENVIELKGDNFDILTLLPTLTELKALQ